MNFLKLIVIFVKYHIAKFQFLRVKTQRFMTLN